MAKVFCTGDRCDNDPSEYVLCKRWQAGHPICRGGTSMTYAEWRESGGNASCKSGEEVAGDRR